MSRPHLVIVGPTATGKSSLALALARRFEGIQIISADSMSVYRGMDIGTAKTPVDQRQDVPHHLLDIVPPSHEFTVSQFRARAAEVLDKLDQAGEQAILVGGTGLYVRSVVDNFTMPGQYPKVVASLEAEADTALLWRRLHAVDPRAASKMEPTNRRRILRALEVCLGSGRPFSSFGPGVDAYPPTRFALVGLEIDRGHMDARIESRYAQQMKQGFLEEVRRLRELPNPMGRTASQALGYRELLAHLDGECSLGEALLEANRRTKKFARRQQRWFRRDPRIRWFQAEDIDLVDQVANWWGERADS